MQNLGDTNQPEVINEHWKKHISWIYIAFKYSESVSGHVDARSDLDGRIPTGKH